MAIEHITDHTAAAIAAVPSPFADATLLLEVLGILVDRMQTVEDALYALIVDRLLSSAAGAQLDQYGDLLVQPRGGLGDTAYRALLRVRIAANVAGGRASAILAILADLVSWADAVWYLPLYPAGYAMGYVVPAAEATDTDYQRVIRQIMAEVRPSGVALSAVTESESAAGNVAGYWGWQHDPLALGWNDGGELNTRPIFPAPAERTQLPAQASLEVFVSAVDEEWWRGTADASLVSVLSASIALAPDAPAGLVGLERHGPDAATYERRGGLVERGAFAFDGSTLDLTYTTPAQDVVLPATADWSLVWRGRVTSSTPALICQRTSAAGAGGLVLIFDGGTGYRLSIDTDGVGAAMSADSNVTDTDWHTIIARRGDGTVDLFVDRVLVESVPDTGVAIHQVATVFCSLPSTADPLGAQVLFLEGDIEALGIWSVRLTDDQVTQTFDALDQLHGYKAVP